MKWKTVIHSDWREKTNSSYLWRIGIQLLAWANVKSAVVRRDWELPLSVPKYKTVAGKN